MRIADWARRVALSPYLSSPLALESSCEWQSVAPEARAFLLAAAYQLHPRKTLIVTANYERALAWHAKLVLAGVPQDLICDLPSGTSALFEDSTPEHIALSDRLGALRALTEDKPWVVLTTPQAVLERTLPKEVLTDAFIDVSPGDEIDPEKLLQQLVNLGYEPQEPVRLPGQFSRRGGIVDIFAAGRELPVRIELFGDEVESIRLFDPNSQRSVGQVHNLKLVPSRETLYTLGDADYKTMLLDSVERESSTLSDEAGRLLEELVTGDAEALDQKQYFDRLELYRPLLHPDSGCALDLLEEGDLLVLDEPLELDSIASRAEEELGQALEGRHNRGEILKSYVVDFMLPPDHLASHAFTLSMSAMNALPDWLSLDKRVDIGATSLEPYRGRAEHLALTLRNWLKEDFILLFSTDQPNRARSVLGQAEIFVRSAPVFEGDSRPSTPHPPSSVSRAPGKAARQGLRHEETEEGGFPETEEGGLSGAFLADGNLGGGFIVTGAKIAVITDAELFGVARLKLPQKRFMEGAPIATVLDLKPGDYVVHIQHGIGIFRGLVKRVEQGVEKEFLFVEYQAPDKLFVPADQLDRIQKYLNPGDVQPKLNKLTGGEWQRTLGKAKEEAKEFARDLVKLYAMRRRVQRKPFPPDTPFQQEMEQTFPWVETPSQHLAIEETKKDLELPWPMDRLVCGDVGFGKTEVAIRAAFKVVQDTRQVAVLCPTTILSEQHFRNFEERLGPFGVRIGLLNRYTHTDVKRSELERLKRGDLDIVIGTHSLLGTGVEFKNLGLTIVDEEQKFGVKQKEMLKKLRTEVDVLTLSATPIPRTLSMALMDIRQMSLINDPPPGRLPIRTFVRPYANEVVREAILRELARGGQVFYVYNRVESIGHIAEKLRNIVPTARIGVAHGQMNEKEIEPIMVGFIKGEIDILLSTTIIESGIDISNVNTLIVEQADRLGLAQLYQLRGRVGRSDRQAYSYLLYNSGRELNEGAMQRLQALQEFSTLGSGYSLAFRDLQIRGAGELLGAKQHGAMANVGYELFTQLINEAVAQLKDAVDGAPAASEIEDPLAQLEPLPTYDVPIEAFLPDSYIKDQAQRLYYYQRMMSCRDEDTLGKVQAEVEDRYGHPTEEVRNAFAIMGLRMRGQSFGIQKLEAKQGRIAVQFKDRGEIPPRVFSIIGHKHRDAYLTRESYVWPFGGNPILAIERMLMAFEAATKQYEEERASLGV